MASEAQWCSAILFPAQVKLAVDLQLRYVATPRFRPKREASHCFVGGLTSEAGAGAGRELDRVGHSLLAFVAGEVVPLCS